LTGTRSPETARREIGVVVPARDEAEWLGACLHSLGPFLVAGDAVVVVDACSRDDTSGIAARAGATVLRSPEPARGLAVARGYESVAQAARAVVVIHADMVVPAEARARILDSLDRDPGVVGGALGHRILDPRRRFRWIEAGNRFRARHWQLPYGDQAQFVRTGAVTRAGGFPVQGGMEDLELSLRLRAVGRWAYLDCPVAIPGRHWRHGVAGTTLRNWSRALLYRARRARHGRALDTDTDMA
jgi:glycosyltransferase involved in cell wall biosynthesis